VALGACATPPNRLAAFAGTWSYVGVPTRIPSPGEIPYRPQYDQQRASVARHFAAQTAIEGNESRCIPNGPIMTMKFTPQIFVDGDRMTINARSMLRFIDVGKSHTPARASFDTYAGESVAQWDGDALLVDTTAMKAGNELSWGVGNGGDLHLVERFRLIGRDRLEIQTTVEDPVVLTQPWIYTNTYTRRAPLSNLEVYYCVPATDRVSISDGVQNFDLTPPEGGYVPPGADR
jgi:hypothetical protein